MAVDTEKSTEYALTDEAPRKGVAAHQWGGKLRYAEFDHTKNGAGDAGSIMHAIKLPAGKVRLVLPLSRVHHDAMGAARTMDIGWDAYTDKAGDAVAADPNGLDDGVDVSSAGNFVPAGTLGGGETKLFESRDGVTITIQINGDTWQDAKNVGGHFIYVVE